eukprot:gnl/TRDRNA2_/TRDRNA2_44670_c0_seq1.p1 gnl/TRDRNA2_/TRDRNA2_44670_c0~~gnl/TRDRNA2_/TRDRNA2_44670_c0_seq1.p1  ORF type:complete len:829 (-),score=107.81 gnl/TRDRNA2_/TRDRNA2_44670_c0_seq1:64-2493(-)
MDAERTTLWLTVLCVAPCVSSVLNPEEYVNTLGGTDSTFQSSHGNVLPAVVRPWGMNAWTPQTIDDGSFWFSPYDVWEPQGSVSDNDFLGIRCTHQPSPWINDYGNFLIVPSDGSEYAKRLRFNLSSATWRPYLFNASVKGACKGGQAISVAVTATHRAAAIRFRFPDDCGQTWNHVAIVVPGGAKVYSSMSDGKVILTSASHVEHGGMHHPQNFSHLIHATLEAEGGKRLNGSQLKGGAVAVPASSTGANELIVRVATSFVSEAQAATNHRREVSGRSFDNLVSEAKAEWHATLGRVMVNDVGAGYSPSEAHGLLEVFYSSLYRAVQFPRLMYEITPEGNEVHFSPYDAKDRILPGAVSTDSGFWDAYRTVYPLLALAYPDQYGRLVNGWVKAWQEGGWLPNWASPGYRSSMSGTMGDVVLAEAIVKNISGFNRTDAYLAISQDAFEEVPVTAAAGRTQLQSYIRFGYIPSDDKGHLEETVSRSLGYMAADHALAKAAEALGRKEDAQKLHDRAGRYGLLFDSVTGFFRPKSGTGEFTADFNEYAWGGAYTEGGPWQYRFAVPHDPQGLANLYHQTGRDLCDELELMNTGPNTIDNLNGGVVMHEMGEMRRNCWGQYAHNNQPVHDALYMYLAVGRTPKAKCSRRGQHWIRKALTELYQPGPSMFPGDEDNGEMGAWFVLSALGLYQLEPAGSAYVIGSPLFAKVTVSLPGRSKDLTIEARGNGKGRSLVDSVRFDGRPLQELKAPYSSLMSGGVLSLDMVPEAPEPPKAKSRSRLRARGESLYSKIMALSSARFLGFPTWQPSQEAV